ncbi:MAG TPA: hypothetical protein VGS19_38975 [Streptosporangiaceae bacterium]|nr:hypothetical protein [Streptosporangiaceae bacterium]
MSQAQRLEREGYRLPGEAAVLGAWSPQLSSPAGRVSDLAVAGASSRWLV